MGPQTSPGASAQGAICISETLAFPPVSFRNYRFSTPTGIIGRTKRNLDGLGAF
jgi:hypothetical protein